MNVFTIAKALGGRKAGRGWSARCPAHDDNSPSLSLREGYGGKVLVRCHAGCSQEEVISSLKARGLWPGSTFRDRDSVQPYKNELKNEHKDEERTSIALSIWQECIPLKGTPAETYLHSRAIDCTDSDRLRFHPRLRHPSGHSGPAMVALVTLGLDDKPIAIHRTFITSDGKEKAPVSPQKMMLGPCHGGSVRLALPTTVLMIGEGIETCLAAIQSTGHPAWAALSTSGMRSLQLPEQLTELIVLADGDIPGETAARACATRWKMEGRRVRIAHPPKGMDFNDILLQKIKCHR